jgi:tetratricopeptide (TPR) repeat protein
MRGFGGLSGAFWAWSVTAALAQPVLLQLPSGADPSNIHAQLDGEDVSLRARPRVPTPHCDAVVVPQLIAPEAAPALQEELRRRTRTFPKGSTLFLLTTDFVEAIEAPNSRTLANSLSKIFAGEQASPPNVPRLLDVLIGWLKMAGERKTWPSLVWIGTHPDLAGELGEFATARLIGALGSTHIRLRFWQVESSAGGILAAAARATAGGRVDGISTGLCSPEPYNAVWEVEINLRSPPAGFRLMRLHLTVDGRPLDPIPVIAAAPAVELPTISAYAEFLALRSQAADLVRNSVTPAATESNVAAGLLDQLLGFNPSDERSLALATGFHKRSGDFRSAARHARELAVLSPSTPSILAEAGHLTLLAGDPGEAEPLLRRSRERAASAHVSGLLARIRARAGDHAAAQAFVEESLELDPEQQDLWLLAADTARSLNQSDRRSRALEEALARHDMIERRTELIELYLQTSQPDRARGHVDTAIVNLPSVVSIVEAYAIFQERLDRPVEGLSLWRRVAEIDASYEPAHVSIARLHFAAENYKAAVEAAETGLLRASGSARLHLLLAESLLALGETNRARRLLRSATGIDDVNLLRKMAEIEDTYGSSAAPLYRRLCEIFKREPINAEWETVARHGLRAAARDGDRESLAWFESQLGVTADSAAPASARNTALVPGGRAGLMFMAHGNMESTPSTFLEDFSRAVAAVPATQPSTVEAFQKRIRNYFGLLAQLKALGRSDGRTVTIELSLADNRRKRLTDKVLALLGWKASRRGRVFIVEPVTSGGKARRQEVAAGLGLDEIEMQEKLQEGKIFVLEIADEEVEILFSEEQWRESFYPGVRLNGGLAEALAADRRLARTYAGLRAMDRQSAEILVQELGLKRLGERYSDVLFLYSSCLQFDGDTLQTPGGGRAVPIWAALARARPERPRQFLRSLLERDDSRLLHFYFTLAQLDGPRQRFFTSHETRTRAFYQIVRSVGSGPGTQSIEAGRPTLFDLFREVPLDEGGRLLFPGGPAVWMATRARASSVHSSEKRLRRLDRVTTPEQEDEILLRLAEINYTARGIRRNNIENFIAIVRIEAAREEPLDEASALLLAEQYSNYSALYPYFMQLGGLRYNEFSAAFQLAQRFRSMSPLDANPLLGQWHALWHYLARAERTGALPSETVAGLFGRLCMMLLNAGSSATFSAAALDFAGDLLEAVGGARTRADDRVRDLLLDLRPLPDSGPRAESRRKDYSAILRAQQTPALDDLTEIHRALKTVDEGAALPQIHAVRLAEIADGLPTGPVPKDLRAAGDVKRNLEAYRGERVPDLARRIRTESGKAKPNKRRLRVLAASMREEICPLVTLALVGPLYGAYFRPEDLIVVEDPFLLRKHEYALLSDVGKVHFPESALQISSERAGSRAVGGFALFADAAATAAVQYAVNLNTGAISLARAQIASIRATSWRQITDVHVLRLAVQLRAARDWILLSRGNPDLRAKISEATLGILSLSRRARLLQAASDGHWEEIPKLASLSDLLFLAHRLRQAEAQADADSPAIDAFVQAQPEPLHELGSSLPLLRGNPLPRLVELPPYEEFASTLHLMPIAERCAEMKLYLAERFAEQAWEASELATVAEAAARLALRGARLTDAKDWVGMIATWRTFRPTSLEEIGQL